MTAISTVATTEGPRTLTERKREAILEAAIAQFREHGFQRASMDAIAAAAGVSKRTVYNHFPSKDELFAAILWQLWQRSRALVALGYSAERPLREQLLELLAQKMRLMQDESFLSLTRVALAEMMHTPERARALVERLSEKEEGVAAWVRAAQADGRLRAVDPQYAAHLLQGQIKAFAFWPQLTMGQPPLDEPQQRQVLADCVDMFLAHFALPR